MIVPGEAPLGMVCGNPAPTFLIGGTRSNALHCDAEMSMCPSNSLILKIKTLDIALFVPPPTTTARRRTGSGPPC